MRPDPKILDDLARVAGGAVNIVSGLQQQFMGDMRARLDEMAVRMDLVPREDLDIALARIDELTRRIETLENQLKPKKAVARKPAAKSRTGNKRRK